MTGGQADPIASHGRGGAGNINPDPNQYVDGGIVREEAPSGTYTSGRGGGGNVGRASQDIPAESRDIVPDNAQVDAPVPAPGHGVSTGRGGGGNILTGEEEEHKGLADKIKEKIFGK
ncbi:hypothetical protein ABW19_dt0200220 [Dactylella cylindrospora]|nr:hypothetical protein ABW19_dt0200220 [Dactylella cylindrospora]